MGTTSTLDIYIHEPTVKRKIILLLSVSMLAAAVAWLFLDFRAEPLIAALAAAMGILTQVTDRTQDSGATAADESTARMGEAALLVMPFDNLSDDPDNEYFSDGLTEELIAALAHVPGLRVISRRSAMSLKGTSKSIGELARELKIDFVVEGGVRKSGHSVRITIHLINAGADADIWSDTYAGSLEDVFAFQEEVAGSIVRALHLRFSPERAGLGSPPTDPRAFEAYLRGKHEMGRWTREACESAIRFFSMGLDILGENALLHAGLGYAHFSLAHIVPGGMSEHMKEAAESARRSLDLDPELVKGHVLSGLVDWKKASIGSALRHFRDALATDPDDEDALTWATWCYATVGDVAFLEGHAQRLVLVDPLNAFSRLVVGLYWIYSANLEAASATLDESLSLDPDSANARSFAAFTEFHRGQVERAKAHLAKLSEVGRDDIWTHLGLALQAAIEGRQLALSERVITDSRKDETFAWFIAECHALLGDKEAAIEWLDHALEWGFCNVAYATSDCTGLTVLRDEPGFEDWKLRAQSRQRQVLAIARRGGRA